MPGTGAKIQIAAGGFTIQPVEFAKLALAVFFASYLVSKRDVLALAGRRFLGIDLPRARDLGPVLIAWAASLLVLVRSSSTPSPASLTSAAAAGYRLTSTGRRATSGPNATRTTRTGQPSRNDPQPAR